MSTTLGAKLRTRFGCWNIRTMSEPSRLSQVIREMNDYKLEFLELSETRWPEDGEHTSSGELLLYSGKRKHHENGVGLLLSKTLKKCVLEWESVSKRIITARLNAKHRKISVIQCYAPTEVSTLEEKELFYEELNATILKVEKSDIIILIGDINAKVGSNTGMERVSTA